MFGELDTGKITSTAESPAALRKFAGALQSDATYDSMEVGGNRVYIRDNRRQRGREACRMRPSVVIKTLLELC